MSAPSRLRRLLMQMYYASLKIFCPGLRNSQFAYREVLTSSVGPQTSWLDLGCGHQFFPDWMPNSLPLQQKLIDTSASVIGVDAYDLRPHSCGIAKVAANIEQLPFADESFSLITANMVVEHVENPERLLREVFRVLAPGGVFLFHTPNANYFEVAIARRLPSSVMKAIAGVLDGRAGDDIFPTHYRMNTAREIQSVAEKCGLVANSIRHVECTAQGVMLGPLVILELMVIRTLRLAALANYRSDLIVSLQKPPVTAARTSRQPSPQLVEVTT
jgi:ubiquinone/menaquinone biosynthesis C-methylase UbiE